MTLIASRIFEFCLDTVARKAEARDTGLSKVKLLRDDGLENPGLSQFSRESGLEHIDQNGIWPRMRNKNQAYTRDYSSKDR
jgi:hypothetical protein